VSIIITVLFYLFYVYSASGKTFTKFYTIKIIYKKKSLKWVLDQRVMEKMTLLLMCVLIGPEREEGTKSLHPKLPQKSVA